MTRPDDPIRQERRSGRCPADGSPQIAVLKMASASLSVVVVEQRMELLAVLANSLPNLWVDDVGQLQTKTERWEVRVASIIRIKSEDAPEAELGTKFRIGLVRVRELPPPRRAARAAHLAHLLRCFLASLLPIESCKVFSGIALAILLVTTPAVLAVLAWNHNSPTMTRVVQWGEQAVGNTVGGNAPRPEGAATTDSAARPATDLAGELRAAIQHLAGPEAFLLPGIADQLKLTAQQQAGFRRLTETTRLALRELDRRWQSDVPADHADKRAMIVQAARQEAMALLTGEQRERWKKLAE